MNLASFPFRSCGAAPTALTSKQQFSLFVEDLVCALEPESGIEYWSDLLPKVETTLESLRRRESFVHHVFAYAATGSNEGMRIEAGVVLGGGEMITMASAKTFGHDDESWRIARHLSNSLELLFWYEQQPYVVDMLRAVNSAYPGRRYNRGAMPRDGFMITTEANFISVTNRDGQELDLWRFEEEDVGAFVQAYAADWLKLLRALHVNVEIVGPHAGRTSDDLRGVASYRINSQPPSRQCTSGAAQQTTARAAQSLAKAVARNAGTALEAAYPFGYRSSDLQP